MPLSFAAVETEHASKYLVQMCKHFAHKVTVAYDKETGRVEFPPGLCLITAEDGRLSFYCRSGEERGIAVMQSIIVKHLVKFAWREEITFDWSDAFPETTPARVQSAFRDA